MNYQWSNLVLVGDGISKYECIAAGKKALIFSSSKINESLSKDFNNLNIYDVVYIDDKKLDKYKKIENFLHNRNSNLKKIYLYRNKMQKSKLRYIEILNKIN